MSDIHQWNTHTCVYQYSFGSIQVVSASLQQLHFYIDRIGAQQSPATTVSSYASVRVIQL